MRTKLCITLMGVLLLSSLSLATPVPDTGQIKCYNNNVEIPAHHRVSHFTVKMLPTPSIPIHTPTLAMALCGTMLRDLSGSRQQHPALDREAILTDIWQQAIDYCNNLSLGG